ncbi:hypothetical protein C9I50_03545 [Pseudomonas prosekii]|nr:hypothetical protein C9I50_03545 [Pseudomonas prosekii]
MPAMNDNAVYRTHRGASIAGKPCSHGRQKHSRQKKAPHLRGFLFWLQSVQCYGLNPCERPNMNSNKS